MAVLCLNVFGSNQVLKSNYHAAAKNVVYVEPPNVELSYTMHQLQLCGA